MRVCVCVCKRKKVSTLGGDRGECAPDLVEADGVGDEDWGTNDAQGISIDGVVHDFGTAGWKAAYARRVDDLVALLRSRDVAVYWVGLPRMKRPTFDARMTIINDVVEGRMKALGVPYLETVDLTSNAQGEYEAYLSGAGGRRQLMRANDGIHMSMAGYLRISAPVAERLKRDAGIGPAATPAP